MSLPLEDSFVDVLGKAQRGLKFTDEQLSAAAILPLTDLYAAQQGEVKESVLRAIAIPLQLNADAFVALALKKSTPAVVPFVEGLRQYNTPYGDMTVNSYLVWDPVEKIGATFDTGADCSAMLKDIESLGLQIPFILLTHTHVDHIADLTKLKNATGARVAVAREEAVGNVEAFAEGHIYSLGGLVIETRLTSGHSRGGTTYLIKGLSQPVAIVGDAIFSRSMGGANTAYAEAIQNNLKKIYSLPENTILCPGHGPMTTVGDEKKFNPFYTI
ncbi:MAG: MBL fold metallo-hydrolase [Verrucomicrobia bacterium Tous-C9LFEB]|nr:MAG: MBL fold metallo-hydrolase [Verrucomicrobia bacterium Tous-C9LFEB]